MQRRPRFNLRPQVQLSATERNQDAQFGTIDLELPSSGGGAEARGACKASSTHARSIATAVHQCTTAVGAHAKGALENAEHKRESQGAVLDKFDLQQAAKQTLVLQNRVIAPRRVTCRRVTALCNSR